MSRMKYDAATLGNHDFDAGLDGLVRQLPHADFPFICSNYDFSDTVMQDRTVPYRIFRLGRVRVGVLGLGIELDGLVPAPLFGKTRYLDPVVTANMMAERLRREHRCHYVICLSHLGFKYQDGRMSDITLAQRSRNIDLVIGGHTHTFLDKPVMVENLDGQEVWINQVGWAGVKLGRVDVMFERNFTRSSLSGKTVSVSTFAS
jgi:5'-nucleotidase